MEISVAIPNDLVDVSNGKFVAKTDLGDGYTRWDWHVHYPINNYDVSLNIGNYVHFDDRLGDLTLDFYVAARQDLDKAKTQFAQAKGDDRGLPALLRRVSVQEGRLQADRGAVLRHGAPERGDLRQPLRERLPRARLDRRRHQPEVRLHHHSRERRTSGSATPCRPPTSPTCGSTKAGRTYLECLYVEYTFGHDDCAEIHERLQDARCRTASRSSPQRGIHREPPQDMYFKGALFLQHAPQRRQRRREVVRR